MRVIKLLMISFFFFIAACGESKKESGDKPAEKKTSESTPTEVMLSAQQFEALGMKVDTLSTRMMSGFVEANGHLEVPPQSEATVTPVIGGNVSSIRVIEGDVVKRGAVLAYISHPDIIKVQTDYINTANRLNFLEKDYARQKKLYEEGVGSGESFQKAESELQSARGHLKGMKAQLRQLNLNAENIEKGNIQQQIPVISPIDGAIQAVNIKTGQFVQSQANMFEIINTEDVHIDLMVFEKDVPKVEEGQMVYFNISSEPGKEMTARILSISKNFERDPKALHVHAEIENREGNLVPGMYVRGRIALEDSQVKAFPQSAIAKKADKLFVFSAEKEGEDWSFKPIEIIAGASQEEWTAVRFLKEVPSDTEFAFNNAYYLMAEMNKGQGGGHHH
ncbi:efflux RND transporter periplasmic adaptor subunit [Salegentibacter chungangensis]|uniref:Efflux RND transporter periplasmic adaptor subunit n=1 Tax=Salegentibacter chungangensis TaxID=1335724 RepID=A0ABW3NSQ5_9FLAO